MDVIGNADEYLIGRFASDAGKKGGEFYTPPEVATLLAKLVAPKPGDTIYDPACGSGSLLIRVAREVGGDNYSLFGQEVNGQTWALCKMNMFLHEIDGAKIEWGDTLNNPKHIAGERQIRKFDVVVANPPFSLDKWGSEDAHADKFQRFHRGTPPKSKADYAFVSHMVESAVADDGRVGVIVPHGVLFRGGAEGKIRKKLIEENLLEAVIGLPANLFFGTGIPAAILLFHKGKKTSHVLFVDASRGFLPGKRQNKLRAEDIDKIVATVRAAKDVEKYAHVAVSNEMTENDHNLNISRYLDTLEQEAPIDLVATQKEIDEIETQLAKTNRETKRLLAELLQ
jgi:type I restriction enzyme M protein